MKWGTAYQSFHLKARPAEVQANPIQLSRTGEMNPWGSEPIDRNQINTDLLSESSQKLMNCTKLGYS